MNQVHGNSNSCLSSSKMQWSNLSWRCMKLTLIISQDAEMFFSIRTSFIHLKKSPTAHSIFYKESVIAWQYTTWLCQRQAGDAPYCHRVFRGSSYSATYEDKYSKWEVLVQPDRKERFYPEECFISESLTAENEEPQSMREALDGENSGKWKEALIVYYNYKERLRGKLWPGWDLNTRPSSLITAAPPTELQSQTGAGRGKWRC